MCESVRKANLLSDHSQQAVQGVCSSAAHLPSVLVLPPFPSCRVRSGVSWQTWTLMVVLTNWVCFLFFVITADVMAPYLV